MNISVKSEYALKAVFDLASQFLTQRQNSGPLPPVKIADIAKRQKIPQKFLELILAGLKQSGFVDSRRGAEGGYLLARSPDAITVGEVLRTVENVKSSPRPHNDPFSDLARSWQEKNSQYVPNWDI
jgi:Rrf2 family cysteine metabolism transcriptional repressor